MDKCLARRLEIVAQALHHLCRCKYILQLSRNFVKRHCDCVEFVDHVQNKGTCSILEMDLHINAPRTYKCLVQFLRIIAGDDQNATWCFQHSVQQIEKKTQCYGITVLLRFMGNKRPVQHNVRQTINVFNYVDATIQRNLQSLLPAIICVNRNRFIEKQVGELSLSRERT